MKMEMAARYDANIRTINQHIKKIYSDAALDSNNQALNQLHTFLNRKGGLTMELLTLKDVSYFYEGTHNGISDISFEAEKGDFIAVVGKNGAEKTTLLHVLSRIYTP